MQQRKGKFLQFIINGLLNKFENKIFKKLHYYLFINFLIHPKKILLNFTRKNTINFTWKIIRPTVSSQEY